MNNDVRMYVDVAREEGLEVAFREIEAEIKGAIADCLNEISEDTLFDFIHDYIDDTLCRMSDFDDVVSYMTPTEILESCGNIDINDEFFNSDSLESSNNIYYLLGHLSEEELVDRIYEEYQNCGSCSVRELDEVMEHEEDLKELVKEEFEAYEKAKKLFDLAMSRDPQAVMSVLWNMNN